MSSFDFPVLDGIAPSFADINVRISGTGVVLINMGDIAALNSGYSVEVGYQREGGRIIKRTRGSVTPEASMTLYMSGYKKLLRGLMAAAPTRGNQKLISLVHFGINVSFTPPGAIDIFEYRIKGCRMMGRTLNSAEGVDATQIEVPLSPIEVVDVVDGFEIAAV